MVQSILYPFLKTECVHSFRATYHLKIIYGQKGKWGDSRIFSKKMLYLETGYSGKKTSETCL